MQARELAEPYPVVRQDWGAVDAARLITGENRLGLIVVDDRNHPVAVLPGSQVLRLIIPGYIRDDRTLAGVVDDDFVSTMCDALEGRTVADLLPKEKSRLPVVGPDETVLEIAALMAAEHSPIVAVVEGPGSKGALVGAITLPAVLGALLPKQITDP
ncbi:CBS domain-containing protein [Nocardioides hankookensis]|uniref:CBS domain-containing protein n=1 Tax=Nocardioides hankookensis TaxID=443157 RepID=A0ABW1LFG1_9ACTN